MAFEEVLTELSNAANTLYKRDANACYARVISDSTLESDFTHTPIQFLGNFTKNVIALVLIRIYSTPFHNTNKSLIKHIGLATNPTRITLVIPLFILYLLV